MGVLEITSPSRAHEVDKKQFARLLELFCLERDIPLFGYGSTTFRKEEGERGLELDGCYCGGADRAIPDLAIEVVWVFESGAFQVFVLRGAGYVVAPASEVLPEIDLEELSSYAAQADQHAALRAFRDVLPAR